MSSIATIILAAGKGTRMKSDLPKVLHPVLGKPMVQYVIELARAINSDKIVLVVGHKKELVQRTFDQAGVLFAAQEKQLGTAHAVQMAEGQLENFEGEVLVLSGDVPLLGKECVRELIDLFHEKNAAATLLVGIPDDPYGYGRVIRDADGFVDRIVEEKDATDADKKVQEVNIGTYIFDNTKLKAALPRVKNDNVQGEYYLPDVIKILREQGERIAALFTPDFSETIGVNTVEHLKEVERIIKKNG